MARLLGVEGHPTGTSNLESDDFEIKVDRVIVGSQAEGLWESSKAAN